MEPVRTDDDRLAFRVTVMAEWPGQGPSTDMIEDTFGGIAPNVEKYTEEEYRDRDPHEFRDSGYVDVHRGFEYEDAGPIAWARITGDEIRFSVYGPDAVRDGYEFMAEWCDEHGDAKMEEFAPFPDFRAFQSTGTIVEPDEGWAVVTDPSRNPHRKHNTGPLVPVNEEPEGDRGVAQVGRWDIDYRADDDGTATAVFVNTTAPTVVLADEVGDVLERFLANDRLLIVDEAELDKESATHD